MWVTRGSTPGHTLPLVTLQGVGGKSPVVGGSPARDDDVRSVHVDCPYQSRHTPPPNASLILRLPPPAPLPPAATAAARQSETATWSRV